MGIAQIFKKIFSIPHERELKRLRQVVEKINALEEKMQTFSDEALRSIANVAFRANEEMENIGARRLHTVMSLLLNEILFDVPDVIGAHAKILITPEMVDEKLAGLVKNKDMSQYIL